MQNYSSVNVRSAAVLTNSYVAGTIIGRKGVQVDNTQNKNQLILYVDFTIGSLTTAEMKIEFSNALYYDLAYDGQTANFTVGTIVKGTTSGAEGTIISDTDGGTTGTLVISPNNDTPFVDDEAITDSNSTPGAAVVNGGLNITTAAPSTYSWYQQTASAISATISSENLLTHQFSGTGKYRIALPLKDKFVQVSVKGTGTVTNSSMRVTAVVGTV